MDEQLDSLSDEVFEQIKPRQWWIFFELAEPLTVEELAGRSSLVEMSVEAHVSVLKRNGLIGYSPTASQPRYRQALKLTSQQEERARQLIQRHRLAPATTEPPVAATTTALRAKPPVKTQEPPKSVSRRWLPVAVILGLLAVSPFLVALATDDQGEKATSGVSDPSFSGPDSEEANSSATASRSRAAQTKKPKRTPTPTSVPTPVISEQEIADQAFLLQIQTGDFPYFAQVPGDKLVNLGHALCEDLDDGYDPYELAFQIAGDVSQTDEVEAAGVVGAAMGAYCPQHQDQW